VSTETGLYQVLCKAILLALVRSVARTDIEIKRIILSGVGFMYVLCSTTAILLLLWFFLSHGSIGGNGIFSRRQDFSSFNSLPRHKLNSYHIKVRPS
jgi:hypothetical protein